MILCSMKKTIPTRFILALACFGFCPETTFANPYGMQNNLRPQPNQNYKLIVKNRILVKVNGNAISVMDVKKKMDFFLHENHKEALESDALRYQFYSQNWKDVLQEMIHNELMLMESNELNIDIPDGDIREEMETRFGPNVIQQIETLGLTYDEAKKMVKEDIIVKNLSWYRIWARVMQVVTPDALRQGYSDHLASLPNKDQWIYQTLTVRGTQDASVEQFAEKAHTYLADNEFVDLTKVVNTLNNDLPKNVFINVSDEICLQSQDLSPEYQSILGRLSPESFSQPVKQISRADGSTVYRIFHLKEHQTFDLPSFEELSSTIRNKLMQKHSEIQREEYFSKLRKRFCCEDLVVSKFIEASYQPFVLTN